METPVSYTNLLPYHELLRRRMAGEYVPCCEVTNPSNIPVTIRVREPADAQQLTENVKLVTKPTRGPTQHAAEQKAAGQHPNGQHKAGKRVRIHNTSEDTETETEPETEPETETKTQRRSKRKSQRPRRFDDYDVTQPMEVDN